MGQPTNKEDSGLNQFFRHLVPVRAATPSPENRTLDIFSSFCFVDGDYAFLVTAGHVLKEDLGQILDDFEGTTVNFTLVDNASIDAVNNFAVPFHREWLENSRFSSNIDLYDFGFIRVPAHHVSLMAANGIAALTPEAIATNYQDFDKFLMVGVPGEANDLTRKGLPGKTGFSAIQIQKTTRPDKTEKYPDDIFFGKVEVPLESVKGMSGGPIFGLKDNKDGTYDWKLCAIQSKWLPGSIVVGCPASLAAHFIREVVNNSET